MAHHLSERCTYIKSIHPNKGKQWFHIRICIMDIVCAWKMLNSTANWKIFYGGKLHAEYLMKILHLEGQATQKYEFLDEIAGDFPIYHKIINKLNDY